MLAVGTPYSIYIPSKSWAARQHCFNVGSGLNTRGRRWGAVFRAIGMGGIALAGLDSQVAGPQSTLQPVFTKAKKKPRSRKKTCWREREVVLLGQCGGAVPCMTTAWPPHPGLPPGWPEPPPPRPVHSRPRLACLPAQRGLSSRNHYGSQPWHSHWLSTQTTGRSHHNYHSIYHQTTVYHPADDQPPGAALTTNPLTSPLISVGPDTPPGQGAGTSPSRWVFTG